MVNTCVGVQKIKSLLEFMRRITFLLFYAVVCRTSRSACVSAVILLINFVLL